MPPRKPVTQEEFTALVAALRAELASVPREQRGDMLAQWVRPHARKPQAFTGNPWVRRRLTLEEAAQATGLSPKSLRDYTGHARRARQRGDNNPHLMPAPHPDGTWEAGALAVWMASRRGAVGNRPRYWPNHEELLPKVHAILTREGGSVPSRTLAQELGIGLLLAQALLREAGASAPAQRLPPHAASDTDVLAFLRQLVTTHGRTVQVQDAQAALRQAGLHANWRRVSRLLTQARQEATPTSDPASAPQPGERAPLESMRWDGLLTSSQLAQAYGVSPRAIDKARRRGLLTPVSGHQHRPYLYDPKRVRGRRDGWPGPVDVDYNGDD